MAGGSGELKGEKPDSSARSGLCSAAASRSKPHETSEKVIGGFVSRRGPGPAARRNWLRSARWPDGRIGFGRPDRGPVSPPRAIEAARNLRESDRWVRSAPRPRPLGPGNWLRSAHCARRPNWLRSAGSRPGTPPRAIEAARNLRESDRWVRSAPRPRTGGLVGIGFGRRVPGGGIGFARPDRGPVSPPREIEAARNLRESDRWLCSAHRPRLPGPGIGFGRRRRPGRGSGLGRQRPTSFAAVARPGGRFLAPRLVKEHPSSSDREARPFSDSVGWGRRLSGRSNRRGGRCPTTTSPPHESGGAEAIVGHEAGRVGVAGGDAGSGHGLAVAPRGGRHCSGPDRRNILTVVPGATTLPAIGSWLATHEPPPGFAKLGTSPAARRSFAAAVAES